MNWLLALVVVAFLYWFLIHRQGKPEFWKVAGRYPDAAYDFVKSLPCWHVFENGLPPDYRSAVPKPDWVGPYRLWIPKLGGKQILVFGKHPDYEESQDEFLRRFRTRT